MKKIIFPLLAISVLIGCSKRENLEGVTPDVPVPIQLNSGVLLSKAPITDGSIFTANVAGWETAGTIDYAAAPTKWVSTAVVTAAPTPGGIALVNSRHYNPDALIKTYMKAWYPATHAITDQITGGTVNFVAGSDFKTDGTTDVLLASQIVGDKVDATNKVLSFNHMLSQVSFKVIASSGLISAPKLKSITIHNAELPTGINLASDELICSAAAMLPVPGIVAGTTVIDTTVKSAGSPVMFKPFAGNTFTITVATMDHEYNPATVTITDAAFVAGKAYAITVTFKSENEIILAATVTPWLTGSGSATVE